jgi:hypothetical protein
MKKFMLLSLAICLALGLSAFAADMGKEVKVTGIITDTMCAKAGDKAKMMDGKCTKGCAKEDGGKLSFVDNADGKIWSIENVDAVKGHEGEEVTINGHTNADKGTLHVVSVTAMASKGKSEEHNHSH